MSKNPKYYLKPGQNFKVLTLLAFSFLFCQSIFSQFYWQRIYERNSQLVGNDMCKTSDGNFVITGATLIPNIGYSVFVMKINDSGDTIWTRTIPNAPNKNDNATVISATTDGGVVIAGQSDTAWACKLDINGNIIWNKKYLLFSRFSEDIILTNDNGFLICGYINDLPAPAFIFKIDSAGSLIWDKTFTYQFMKVFYSIAQHNSGFILTGFETLSIGLPSNLIVFCINNNGDSLWQKTYNGLQGREIIKLNQNYYIGCEYADSIYAQMSFMKINLNGDSIYTRKFSDYGRNNFYACFNIVNNRLVFTYERDSSFGITQGIGLLSDTMGNIINKVVFTNSNFRWGALRAIVPISNGNILFGGTAQMLPLETRVIYCVKTDSLLNTSEFIGINLISSNIPNLFVLKQNYPNPFNPVTNIKFEIPRTANIKIAVYDMLGREVDILVNGKMEAGTYNASWNAMPYSSGVYFYRFTSDDFISVKKMILIK